MTEFYSAILSCDSKEGNIIVILQYGPQKGTFYFYLINPAARSLQQCEDRLEV